MPFSQILRIFQTISLVALFILPINNHPPSFISPEFNSGSKHRSLCWMISNKYAALFLTLLRKVSPKMENNLFCIAK